MSADCIKRQHKTTKTFDRAQPSVEFKIVDGCLDLFHPLQTPLIRLAASAPRIGHLPSRIGRNSGKQQQQQQQQQPNSISRRTSGLPLARVRQQLTLCMHLGGPLILGGVANV